jgi:broad specificity phosphatase PhoE
MNNHLFCDIYLIRHGETDWNKQGKLQGHLDVSLNEVGKIQAQNLQNQFNSISFAAAFSSDLARARQTAEIILESKNIPIKATSALRERHMGQWEGLLTKDLKNWLKLNSQIDRYNQEEFLSYKWDPTAENYTEVFNRLKVFLSQVYQEYLGSTILLSSHGGLLRSVLYHLDFKFNQRWNVNNCGFMKLRLTHPGKIIIIDYQGINTSDTHFTF